MLVDRQKWGGIIDKQILRGVGWDRGGSGKAEKEEGGQREME